MVDLLHTALDIEDLRQMARRRLPKGLFDFIDRGSEDDVASKKPKLLKHKTSSTLENK